MSFKIKLVVLKIAFDSRVCRRVTPNSQICLTKPILFKTANLEINTYKLFKTKVLFTASLRLLLFNNTF